MLTVCQFRTRDQTTAKTPVNLSRLALEVCRGVEKFVDVSGRATLLRIAALSTVAIQEMEEREKKGRGVHGRALEGGGRLLSQSRHPHACLDTAGDLWVMGSVHLHALSGR